MFGTPCWILGPLLRVEKCNHYALLLNTDDAERLVLFIVTMENSVHLFLCPITLSELCFEQQREHLQVGPLGAALLQNRVNMWQRPPPEPPDAEELRRWTMLVSPSGPFTRPMHRHSRSLGINSRRPRLAQIRHQCAPPEHGVCIVYHLTRRNGISASNH
jgi:hypothetical protein